MSAIRILTKLAFGARLASSSNSISVLKITRHSFCSKPASISAPKDLTELSSPIQPLSSDVSVFGPADPVELADIARHLRPTYTFASYVNESETLQQLVKLGVDLSKLEKRREIVEYVLQLNFYKDVKPYIQFLHDHGVDPGNLGLVLTKNINICRESLEDLKVRINYLESKKFNNEMISGIITRNPLWLTTPVSVIDRRLGWLQTNFKLSGNDVREVVNALPQIVTFNINTIKLNIFVFEEEMGMTKGNLKGLLKKRPRLFIKNQKKLLGAFEYAHNVMRVPLETICLQPDILMERTHKIKERHLFLESLGRAQYNPQLPGYVSLDAFIKSDEVEFCTSIAKSSVQSYNLFLKTM